MSEKESSLEATIKHLQAQLVAAQAQLKAVNADKAKYKKLFEVSVDALSIIDMDTGKFIECNQAAINMHGVENETNFLNVMPSELSPKYQPGGERSDELSKSYIENTFKQGSQLFKWVHARLDGSTFPCLVSLTAIEHGNKNLILAIGRDITELSETQDQLDSTYADMERFQSAYHEEKEKFEQFVNLAPVGIAINRLEDGAFEYVNDEFGRFTGYDVNDLNQMDYWQLTPQMYESQEQEQLTSLTETGRYGPYQKEYIHKDGHTYPVLLSGIKIAKQTGEEYIWSVVQDISEQHLAENQIQAAKEQAELSTFRLKLANDSAGIGVWEWDVATNSLIWDEWMYKLYGITSDDFSGAYEAWENSVHPEDIEMARTRLANAVQGEGVYDPEFRVVHPDGQVRTMKATAEVIRDAKGNALKVVGVNYDVTERIQTIDALELAKQQAEEANQSKNAFLANMSHEIRTPMNAILGGLQLLRTEELSEELQTVLQNASWSATSLLTIINDILDYSKITENKLDLESEPFSVKQIVESVKFDVNGLASSKGISVVNIIDEHFVDGWLGDVVRVKQILLNLATNAVKFTEKGQVKIEVSSPQRKGKQCISLSVIDSGIGMSEEAQSRIFERFSQADSSTTRKFGGTGLGMAITINLIKMMDGTISLNSAPNQGTTVCVVLPLSQTEQFHVGETHKSIMAPKLRGKRILVAEDNEINQMILQTMLSATEASLTMVENGKLALEAVEGDTFDLVIMDIQMPEMDGEEALQRISKIKPDLPVIAVTANAMVDDVEHYLKVGFSDHVAKPIDLNKLYSLLSRYSA